MSAVSDLIEQVENQELRERLRREVDKLNNHMKGQYMKKTTHVFLPCLVLCALLAGCGKQSQETLTEKLIEKSLSRDGVAAKVDLDGGTMKFSTTDAQGRKADFKVEGDTVQVVSEDGVMTFASGENTKVPQNFPEDVLVYAGAKPVSAMLVERGRTPRNSDIVIACVDGAWTMKYFFKDSKGVRLEPANRKYDTIRPRQKLAVEGVVSSVIRKLV